MIWHSTSIEDVANKLETDISNGLNDQKVAENIKKYGENKLADSERPAFFQRFFKQLKAPAIIVLLVASVITFIIGYMISSSGDNTIISSGVSSLMIILIVVINAVLGAWREGRAERTLTSLKDMFPPMAKVIRNGEKRLIKSIEVVPGDIIILEEGDYIPADGRIIKSFRLHCNEENLTGESVPVEKYSNHYVDDITPVNERTNMVYAGCSVTQGNCIAVATDTGMFTEIGKLCNVLEKENNADTPLRQRLIGLSKTLSVFVLFICAFILIYGVIFGTFLGEKPFLDCFIDVFMAALSLAVVAIPEGLGTVVTVVLAANVYRAYKKHIAIKTLAGTEKLGDVSVICADKTGTITDNKMNATYLFDGSQLVTLGSELSSEQKRILLLASLCCDSSESDRSIFTSTDTTDMGIADAASKFLNMDKENTENMYPRLCEIPFDNERKLRTSVNMINGHPIAIVRGAPDILLSKCVGEKTTLFKEAYDKMGSQALRVIGVAFKQLDFEPTDPTPEELENNLCFCGLIGLENSIRDDAFNAVEICKKAGIRVVMFTGDHISTAVSVGEKSGILTPDTIAVTGEDLAKMTDDQLDEKIESISVYARITPEDRVRIVNAWKRKKEIVAVTGDGIEDAPALDCADVGCALGSGSEVAKNASDITVTDDRFSTVVSAIELGRGIFDSIRKAISFILVCSVAELFTVLFGMLIWRVPVQTAVELILLNFISVCLPALALGNSKPNRNLMIQANKRNTNGLFTSASSTVVVFRGILIGIVGFISFTVGYTSTDDAQIGCTMAFLTLCFAQVLHSFASSSRFPVLAIKKYNVNLYLFVMGAIAIAVTLIVTLTPLSDVFNLVALSGSQWTLSIILALVVFVLSEIGKVILSKKEVKSGKTIM